MLEWYVERMRTSSETVNDLETAIARLTQLGAKPDEIKAFTDTWDEFDEHWTPETRAVWLRSSDAALLEELKAVRVEHHEHTHTEEESEALQVRLDAGDLVQEASNFVNQNIETVLRWVDGDPAKAEAARSLEASNGGSNRQTLLAHLTDIVGDGDLLEELVDLTDDELAAIELLAEAEADAIEINSDLSS